jgi:hypothetical protein
MDGHAVRLSIVSLITDLMVRLNGNTILHTGIPLPQSSRCPSNALEKVSSISNSLSI